MKNSPHFRPLSLPFIFTAVFLWMTSASGSGAEAGWDPQRFQMPPSPVNPAAITVEGNTEIKWMPEAFEFTPGSSLRYIDFEGGDDTNDGRSPDRPWKHHPWDPQARGQAAAESGAHTYVFKGGVIYRGQLVAGESGTDEEPIQLTRDPEWGEGIATLAGSVVPSGWRRASDEEAKAAGIPDASLGKVWVTTLEGDFVPRAGWVLNGDGSRERVPLARWPNWEIEHPYNHFTQWFRVEEIVPRFPVMPIFAPKVLNDPDPHAYDGATVWMEHPNSHGSFSITGIFPSAVQGYDPNRGIIRIPLEHPRRHPQVNSPFFLENLPRFLDTDGEWTFVPEGRKLYLRLPGDADPNQVTFEVAEHPVILDIIRQRNIEVSGLRFTGGNAFDYNEAARAGDWTRPANFTQMGAIRLLSGAQGMVFRNLDIRDTAGIGITNWVTEDDDLYEDILIADSAFVNIDNDGIYFSIVMADSQSPRGEVTDIRVYRNRLENIGLRCSVSQGGRAINFFGLKVGEIAGNVVQTVGGHGINVFSGQSPFTPLVRVQVHGNQVSEALIQKTDFGNFEFWGHGTTYVYNNIAVDPVGYVASRDVYHKGEAFYFDHGVKGFLFNNIGWCRDFPEAALNAMGQTFFKEVRNRWNQAFHNTAYHFRQMQNMEGRHGDQQHYLSNLFIQNHERSSFLAHWGLDDVAEIGYARNILAGTHGAIYARWQGARYETIEEFQAHIRTLDNQVTTDEPAWFTDEMPVIDPDQRDFRLTDTSAAIDRGVRVFVPWSLYGNVGEWFFRHHPRDPNTVLGYDLYPQEMYGTGTAPLQIGSHVPGNELVGEGFTSEDYREGVLEDWNKGALHFDGSRSMRIPQERLVRDIKRTVRNEEVVFDGRERFTVRMTDNNFLIETVLRTEPGQGGGVVAGKLDPADGYALGLTPQGHPVLLLRSEGDNYSVTGNTAVNDGVWHHVLAEVDRAAGTVTLYVNGVDASGEAAGRRPAPGASLDNESDFVVGHGFVGALDYLRITRGTLADARTNIDELMAWQFNGPHFRDFVGREPTGGVRDAGALEHPTVSGVQEIVYTPRRSAAEAAAAAEFDPGEFQTDGDRQSQDFNWGSVSFPKEAALGERAAMQVVFGVETIERSGMRLRIDLHGWEGGNRIGPVAQGQPVNIVPGATDPYTVMLNVPNRAGLTRVTAVIYVSPDGTYGNRTLSTEVSIPVAENAAPPAAPAGPAWLEGEGRITGEYEWGRISLPARTKAGEEMEILVDLKPGAVPNAQVLQVDIHWWEGQERRGPLTRARRIQVNRNTRGVQVARVRIPDREGLTRIAAIVYVAPNAEWSRKIFNAELGGVEVTR
ncbi:MAG: hypothetical protein JJU05_10120 [Verrucomicrobia bacterium]|nr:hypothetical protein [Verrucomicrobiota bacterium]MCH8526644.1 LamG domain-containing protein [Kiritimatiellia bacterium]